MHALKSETCNLCGIFCGEWMGLSSGYLYRVIIEILWGLVGELGKFDRYRSFDAQIVKVLDNGLYSRDIEIVSGSIIINKGWMDLGEGFGGWDDRLDLILVQ